MINTVEFGHHLKENGFSLFCGVPCSFLSSLMNVAINTCDYISATNEGDAIATCAGASLSGKKSVMLMQNSGLGNAVSPITSLLKTFQIPVLIIVSLRGDSDISDEPQHQLMGKITTDLLSLMDIDHAILSDDITSAKNQISLANNYIEQGKPYAFVVKKGTFEKEPLKQSQQAAIHPETTTEFKTKYPVIGSRTQALSTILNFNDCAILSTTGKTGRECFEINDSNNQFYQIGSMGCVSALALGVAYSTPNLPVIAIDGDGAALMRLGSFATTGFYSPKNLCHIVLDNGVHDSTGGQKTAAEAVNFIQLAHSLNYTNVIGVSSLAELNDAISNWKTKQVLTFIYVRIKAGSPSTLGRPTVTPQDVAKRFSAFIKAYHD